MGLETEISNEELYNLKMNEISDIIVRAYREANVNTEYSAATTLKKRWQDAGLNAKRHGYLIYLDKYFNGNKFISKSIKDYLVSFLEDGAMEDYNYAQGKFISEKKTNNILFYSAGAFGAYSAMLSGYSYSLGLLIPAIILFTLSSGKKLRILKAERQTELNYTFRLVEIDELRELSEKSFDDSMQMAKDKISKLPPRK